MQRLQTSCLTVAAALVILSNPASAITITRFSSSSAGGLATAPPPETGLSLMQGAGQAPVEAEPRDNNRLYEDDMKSLETALEDDSLIAWVVVWIAFVFMVCLTLGVVLSNFKATQWLPESASTLLIAMLLGVIICNIIPQMKIIMELVYSMAHGVLIIGLLPLIIFASGWQLITSEFSHQFTTILVFAVFGTVLTTIFIGFTSYFVGGHLGWHSVVDLRSNLVFAALIAAVDPVATLATFKMLEVDKQDPQLNTLVTSESVLNDAVAIIVFTAVNEEVTHFALWPKLLHLCSLLFGSMIFGVVMAALLIFVIRISNMYGHTHLQLHYLFLSAYFIYNAAEVTHVFSGIIANLMAGAVFSKYFTQLISANGARKSDVLLEVFAELNEKAVFVICGICGVIVIAQDALKGFAVVGLLLCLVGRFLSVTICSIIANGLNWLRCWHDGCHFEKMKMAHLVLMNHSGLRGGVSLVLAFKIGAWCHHKSAIVHATFVIICALLLVLGGTTSLMLRLTNITGGSQPMNSTRDEIPYLESRSASVTTKVQSLLQDVLVGNVESPVSPPGVKTIRTRT